MIKALKPDISIIVMAYNEAGSLGATVKEIASVLKELDETSELIIVDDGSKDSTGEIADKLSGERDGVRAIHHEANKGLGAVYRTGFDHAQGNLISFFPADGQFPANIIKQFVPLMDVTDIVLGYLPERKSSLLSKGLSKVERVLFRILFGPMPKFQGVMMFKKTLLDTFKLKSSGRGWTIVMELILRAQKSGYRMMSVPTEYRPRMEGRSKVNNLSTIWANFMQLITLRSYF